MAPWTQVIVYRRHTDLAFNCASLLEVRRQPTRMNVVYLVLDSRTGDGFVYLPGRGDEWYRENTGTIIRDGLDGKWIERHLAALHRRALDELVTAFGRAVGSRVLAAGELGTLLLELAWLPIYGV
jgi:hypothetical protein